MLEETFRFHLAASLLQPHVGHGHRAQAASVPRCRDATGHTCRPNSQTTVWPSAAVPKPPRAIARQGHRRRCPGCVLVCVECKPVGIAASPCCSRSMSLNAQKGNLTYSSVVFSLTSHLSWACLWSLPSSTGPCGLPSAVSHGKAVEEQPRR